MTIDFTAYKTRLELMCQEAVSGSKAMPDPLVAEPGVAIWLINIHRAIGRRANPQVVQRLVSADLVLIRGGVDAETHGGMWEQLLTDGGTVLEYFETNRTMLTTTQTRANMIAGMVPGSIEIDLVEAGTFTVGIGRNARQVRGTQYELRFLMKNRTTQTNV